jgi:hypothetical protein
MPYQQRRRRRDLTNSEPSPKVLSLRRVVNFLRRPFRRASPQQRRTARLRVDDSPSFTHSLTSDPTLLPNPFSLDSNTLRPLFDHVYHQTRILGTYTLRPQNGKKFHHLMEITLDLSTAREQFLGVVLFVCFDIGTVHNVTESHENINPTDVQVSKGIHHGRDLETSVGVGVKEHVELSAAYKRTIHNANDLSFQYQDSMSPTFKGSGDGTRKASWHLKADDTTKGLPSNYVLRLEVDSKPLFVGYALSVEVADRGGNPKAELQASEALCLYGEAKRPLP